MKNYAITDLLETFHKFSLIAYFAWSDIRARYKRSLLGPLWIVLGTAVAVLGLGFLWSTLLKIDRSTFIPSITLGLVIWQFIAGSITESSNLFIQKASLIKNIKLPYLIYPVQLLLRQLINLAHNSIVVIVVLIIFPPSISLIQLLALPGLVLVLLNLFWISILIGMLTARFRDLEQIITAFMPILFFLSPVIYKPSQLGLKEQIVWFNPFSYMISLIRDPIEGVIPHYFVYGVSITACLMGSLLTLWFFNRYYRRIAFWV
jgi:ABC-type polysaccharide/polyol phosphate export permease